MPSPKLREVSRRIVEELTDVEESEEVLVVTDPEREWIARSLMNTDRLANANAVLAIMPRIEVYGNEPPDSIVEAMEAVDIAFTITSTSLTHTDARRRAVDAGTRTLNIRGATYDTLINGGINTDYENLRNITTKISDKLTKASSAHVTSEIGTDITLSLDGRNSFSLDGHEVLEAKEKHFDDDIDATVKSGSGIPTGEAPIAPLEGQSQGKIVIDYSMDNIGLVDNPIELQIKDGMVEHVSGGGAAIRLQELIEDADDSARNLAEFAIGTNPDARLTGILCEDKKASGTVHFAIGDNKSLNGNTRSEIHLDGMVTKPTVDLDGETIVEEGELTV